MAPVDKHLAQDRGSANKPLIWYVAAASNAAALRDPPERETSNTVWFHKQAVSG